MAGEVIPSSVTRSGPSRPQAEDYKSFGQTPGRRLRRRGLRGPFDGVGPERVVTGVRPGHHSLWEGRICPSRLPFLSPPQRYQTLSHAPSVRCAGARPVPAGIRRPGRPPRALPAGVVSRPATGCRLARGPGTGCAAPPGRPRPAGIAAHRPRGHGCRGPRGDRRRRSAGIGRADQPDHRRARDPARRH